MIKLLFAAACALLLGACGSGGVATVDSSPPPQPVSSTEAARFLHQASFGASLDEIDALTSIGFAPWLERQFALPASSHLDYVNGRAATLAAGKLTPAHFVESFWSKANLAPDQLRQRVSFALSEIFVVSSDSDVGGFPRSLASYYDMLGRNAFGNFRVLLEEVALHPAMGVYLSHLHNQKENPAKGSVPDENFAREVMQLFTIGLYELNNDGSIKRAQGIPIETYTNEDISGLAKVFTGWSWAGPDTSSNRFWGVTKDPNREIQLMQPYPSYHSTSVKSFLGVTIPAQNPADPRTSLKIALDTLFNHPNVGPFIGRQLIQRLVKSNPSPAYVSRVAAAFNDNGKGVRGDMKSVITAILLDAEARAAGTTPESGRLREPIIRLANWMRATKASSNSGNYLVGDTRNAMYSLGQTPLASPSVFNFYRPGFTPPGTALAASGYVAPEFQINNEISVAGYVNFIQGVIDWGVGATSNGQRDIQPQYDELIALADSPATLVDRVNLVLAYGSLRASTVQTIVNAVSAIAISTTNAANAAAARKNRVKLALFLTMASSDYLIQQ